MNGKPAGVAIALATLCLAGVALAQSPHPAAFTGGIAGQVVNASGMPQMGATVLLLDRMDRVVTRAFTDESGAFLFPSLAPGVYSLRVTLASFLPAVKRNIQVQPGMRSLLSVNLAGALSTIELVYTNTSENSFMSDQWKWALRSAISTRPVLRLRPAVDAPPPVAPGAGPPAFSDTRAIVRVSGGEEGRITPYGNEPDLGTAFALATSLFGTNQLQFSGNVGYSAAMGSPSAGFRTSYGRGAPGVEPDARFNLTMRQLFLPMRAGVGLITGQQGAAPALRTMEAGFSNRKQLSENLRVEYGLSIESVSFLNTLNYSSPFGRLTYDLEDGEAVEIAFSSGAPPPDLIPFPDGPNASLQRDLAALALFPRVSLRDGRARVQRTTNFEVAYRRTVGPRTFTVAAYQESVKNLAVTMVAPEGTVPPTDLLPDLLSNSAVFNAGDYRAAGYMLSVTQSLLDDHSFTLAAGSGNALLPAAHSLDGAHPEGLRGMLRHSQRRWAALVVNGRIRSTGTRYTGSYQWADKRSLTAGHLYLTQSVRPDIGLNVYVRQPVPSMPGVRNRLEATVDLRNLLAQGYLPFVTLDGRRVLLLHSPRSLRGGVSFIF